jgi:hypothetical protein
MLFEHPLVQILDFVGTHMYRCLRLACNSIFMVSQFFKTWICCQSELSRHNSIFMVSQFFKTWICCQSELSRHSLLVDASVYISTSYFLNWVGIAFWLMLQYTQAFLPFHGILQEAPLIYYSWYPARSYKEMVNYLFCLKKHWLPDYIMLPCKVFLSYLLTMLSS